MNNTLSVFSKLLLSTALALGSMPVNAQTQFQNTNRIKVVKTENSFQIEDCGPTVEGATPEAYICNKIAQFDIFEDLFNQTNEVILLDYEEYKDKINFRTHEVLGKIGLWYSRTTAFLCTAMGAVIGCVVVPILLVVEGVALGGIVLAAAILAAIPAYIYYLYSKELSTESEQMKALRGLKMVGEALEKLEGEHLAYYHLDVSTSTVDYISKYGFDTSDFYYHAPDNTEDSYDWPGILRH